MGVDATSGVGKGLSREVAFSQRRVGGGCPTRNESGEAWLWGEGLPCSFSCREKPSSRK